MPIYLKYIFSYFFDVPVETRTGSLNPVLRVNLSNGKYTLDSGTVNYSFGSLHTIFRKTFEKIHLYRKQVGNCLILGFGGGSIASILKSHYPSIRITGVEADPVVIELARKYFHVDQYQYLDIIIDDALHFINQSSGTFDLITVDVFLDHAVPEKIASEEFYRSVRRLLAPDGMLVINRCILNYMTGFNAENEINKFKKVFSDGFHVMIKQNLMLMNKSVI